MFLTERNNVFINYHNGTVFKCIFVVLKEKDYIQLTISLLICLMAECSCCHDNREISHNIAESLINCLHIHSYIHY